MKTLGLTGGVGMGKSACGELLRRRKIPVVDTGELARRVVEPDQPAFAEVQQLFGSEIIGPDGHLRREELGRRVFSDAAARKALEQILHPRIRDQWLHQIETWRQEGQFLAVVMIPLLFETHAEREFDATVCVACSLPSQRERLLARGWSLEHIQQRIAAQWPINNKIACANYVIWSEGSLDIHAEQLERILKRFRT